MPVVPNTLAEISRLSDDDKAVIPLPLSDAAFALDSSGVAGFFGGDSSVAGMETVNLIPGRRLGGWYNTPGSYEIAKQYGPLGNWAVCDALFPDGEHDPARLFKIDGNKGPQFIAAHSGTILPRTGHVGYLITRWAKEEAKVESLEGENLRLTTPTKVTIVCLNGVPAEETVVNLQSVADKKTADNPPQGCNETATTIAEQKKDPYLPTHWTYSPYFSLLPILVSVGACVICALVADWFCFASIAMGIVAHGSACYAIGSGKLTFKHHKPAKDSPPGDGVLKGDGAVVILVGDESAVSAFTRGHFHLKYGNPTEKGSSAPNHTGAASSSSPSSCDWICYPWQWLYNPPQWLIGPCALLLVGQFLTQLLLIPLGTLFGQLMFIATVVASWIYNTLLSSINREKIQTQILFDVFNLKEEKHTKSYELQTWTVTVAFTSFVLASMHPLDDPRVLLDAMLPNNTAIWKAWKEAMSSKLMHRTFFEGDEPFVLSSADLGTDMDKKADNRGLRDTILRDTEDAWNIWCRHRGGVGNMAAAKRAQNVAKSE